MCRQVHGDSNQTRNSIPRTEEDAYNSHGSQHKLLYSHGKQHLKMMLHAIKVCWELFFFFSHMAIFIFKVFLFGSWALCEAAGLVWPNCEMICCVIQ